MPITFHTLQQHMTFVDQITRHVQDAGNLLPGRAYDVFFVLANSDEVEALNVQVHVVHSAFGIGFQAGDSNITQPALVNVPPILAGDPGLATVQFAFVVPEAGHGCLQATIQTSGPSLSQNITVCHVPMGAGSMLSFLVYGDLKAAEKMTLNLTETQENGSVVPAAQSWNPLLVAPAGIAATTNPTPAPLAVNLPPGGVYSIGLQVTVPAGAVQARWFRITGTITTPGDAGEADFLVQPSAGLFIPPAPYVGGGVHSPDIVLIDPATHTPVPLIANTDALLRPSTDYGIKAIVHNSSPTMAKNTLVRFWQLPGGLSSMARLIDVKTADVPPLGQVVVTSDHPFQSAPGNGHFCAAVTIYNAQASGSIDTPMEPVPSPGNPGDQSYTAWRNTHSAFAFIGKGWEIELALGFVQPRPDPVEKPILVEIVTQKVSADFGRQPAAMQAAQILRETGGHAGLPVFLLANTRATLPAAPLNIRIQGRDQKLRIERASPITTNEPVTAAATVFLAGGLSAPIVISGVIPNDAKAGDIFLVEAVAHYPQASGREGSVVRFTHALHVQG